MNLMHSQLRSDNICLLKVVSEYMQTISDKLFELAGEIKNKSCSRTEPCATPDKIVLVVLYNHI